MPRASGTALIERLRAAGCVFAEQEAAALVRVTRDPARLELLLRRRESGEPLEHVVGSVEFGSTNSGNPEFGSTDSGGPEFGGVEPGSPEPDSTKPGPVHLAVGPGVFVPRQRSLLLAALAVRIARAQRAPVVLEACAGVAPIASAVAAAVPGAQVHASDVDPRALRYARRNLPAGAGVHLANLLDAPPAELRGRVTLLVAVPPYVPVAAADLLPREAREYEPAAALFGGPDGLDRVRELIDGAGPWLTADAQVLVELHTGQYAPAAAYARSAGFDARRHDADDGQTTVLALSGGRAARRA